MLLLTIRTDKPDAEIGLFQDGAKLAYSTWQAHRRLAETIHLKIQEVLESQNYNLAEIEGIAAFKGPGSFTGLRIGLSVANTLAYTCDVPIVSTAGKDWVELGVAKLQGGQNDHIALPEYGSPPHITLPRK